MPNQRKSPPVTLYVVPIEGTWRVRHSAVIYGPDAAPQAAIAKAIGLARRLGAPPRDATVLVETADHQFRVAWASSGRPASAKVRRRPRRKPADSR